MLIAVASINVVPLQLAPVPLLGGSVWAMQETVAKGTTVTFRFRSVDLGLCLPAAISAWRSMLAGRVCP